MPRRDAQAGRVFQGADRGRAEEGTLFRAAGPSRPVDDLGDLLAAEDADDVIDAGHFLQQVVLLALGQAAGDDDRADSALILEGEHLADDGERFLPGRLDEAARVDDDDVGPVGVGDERVAVLAQLAEHALGIDQVLRTAEADEGEGWIILHLFVHHCLLQSRIRSAQRSRKSLHPMSRE